MTKPERIAAIREAIAKIEAEECSCRLCRMCLDNDTACEYCGGTGTERNCPRCQHFDDLDAQLREAEGQDG